MTAWELRDDLALYRDGALVGMLLDRDTAAEVVDSLRTSGEANARLREDCARRVQDLQREQERQMRAVTRNLQRQIDAAHGDIRRVSSEGVDNPVASVTLHDRTPAIDDGVTYAEERAAEDAALAAAWAPGDRYVWTSTPVDPQVHARVFPGSAGPGPRLELRGVVVDDPGAGQMLTVRHDGETDTALVYRDQLTPERDRG